MTNIISDIAIAIIGAIPPTIFAIAAWKRAGKLAKPLDQVNNAVNHRSGNQKKLIEVIDDISTTMENINYSIERVENELINHKAWHQTENEKYE